MELDTGIIYVLLFLFFVLPSLLKRKKKKAASKQKKQAFGLGKLGQTLRTFIRDLEQQALEAKNKAANQATSGSVGQVRPSLAGDRSDRSIWEMLDDRQAPAEVEAVADTPAEPEPVRPPRADRRGRPEIGKKGQGPEVPVSAVPVALPAHALQRAVVWSEILGPPKALQKE